jgi:hypothetical protein
MQITGATKTTIQKIGVLRVIRIPWYWENKDVRKNAAKTKYTIHNTNDPGIAISVYLFQILFIFVSIHRKTSDNTTHPARKEAFNNTVTSTAV